MVIYRGAKFYPTQVEKVVRSFDELSDEFRIELTVRHPEGSDLVTIVTETSAADQESLTARLRQALRNELLCSPDLRFVTPGSLERTMFKAKRIVDLRG
jgi:phenylacetate-CoA ligase